MSPILEPRQPPTDRTLDAEEEGGRKATSGRFSSFLSQGCYSYAPSVADAQGKETPTGGGATSGSPFSPFDIQDDPHLDAEKGGGQATSGWFSSFPSQGYYSYASSVADTQENQIPTGEGAPSGSLIFPFDLQDSPHLRRWL